MEALQLDIAPVGGGMALKERVYEALKRAITSLDLSTPARELRLDERRLSEDLGVSRTPVREALARLEQEGFVRTVPRRGAFVVRKSKREVMEMIQVWAALESMAARLITERASDAEIGRLRELFATFDGDTLRARIDEYSESNVEFHQTILRMSGNRLLTEMGENLFLHMRAIRMRTIGEGDRASRSIIDHMHIIEALESRDTERAEALVREHNLQLARHVARHVDWLED